MAIVNMSKFNLFVFKNRRMELLKELQRFKYVHFSNLNQKTLTQEEGLRCVEVSASIVEIDDEVDKVRYGIDILSKFDTRKTNLKSLKDGVKTYEFHELEQKIEEIDYHSFYLQIKDLAIELERKNNEIVKLKALIKELKPWEKLNIPNQSLSCFKYCDVFLGSIPKKLEIKMEMELLNTRYSYFQIISEDKENIYIFALSHKSESEFLLSLLRDYSFTNLTLYCEEEPKQEILNLEKQVQQLKIDKEQINQKLSEWSIILPELEIVYDYLMCKRNRLMAAEKFVGTTYLDVIEGYIPTKMELEFKSIIHGKVGEDAYLEINETSFDDPDVPVLLNNSKFAKSFESLVEMYALPKYNGLDPTPLFSLFYVLFFGMMVADIGYGLLMLVGALTVLKFINLKEKQKNFIRFFYYLSYSTILWGVIYGSLFGDLVPLPTLINPSEQYNLLLVLSIAFGVVHIFFALGIKGHLAIKEGKLFDAIFDVGFWYLALGGAIFYLITMFTETTIFTKSLALSIMILGMVGILLTGGRKSKGIGGKIGGGLYSLYGLTSYVGDFVSYSRLMALGLSGGFIASAINMMVGMLFETGFLGIIFGVIVFLVGQAFNIFLSILGSYVHTIRLTYVEFFGKFYEGGGKAFQVYRNEPKYINIK